MATTATQMAAAASTRPTKDLRPPRLPALSALCSGAALDFLRRQAEAGGQEVGVQLSCHCYGAGAGRAGGVRVASSVASAPRRQVVEIEDLRLDNGHRDGRRLDKHAIFGRQS